MLMPDDVHLPTHAPDTMIQTLRALCMHYLVEGKDRRNVSVIAQSLHNTGMQAFPSPLVRSINHHNDCRWGCGGGNMHK